MFPAATLLAFTLLAVARAQQVGTQTAETHPPLTWQSCTAGGSCTNQNGAVVLDANWRWLHTTSGYTNCYTGNTWDATLCPDAQTCAQNCALDGADYTGTYGITTTGNALTLKFVTKGANTNVGSRVYLMASDTSYEMFKMLNQEFTFDVDVSQLPCGLNGAVYFSEMAADGGLSKYSTNKAGAKYGTGYCDSQCPRDLKFINGLANVAGWDADPNSANSGTGNWGSCCSEMDIWEANSISAAVTPHPCTVVGQTECSGDACGTTDRYASACDPDGCDFNSFRMGNKTFYGPGLTVDTTKKITVVTQFLTNDGTSTGTLSEIKRFYVQNGVVIPNSESSIAGVDASNSITSQFCDEQKAAFGDNTDFQTKGGLSGMGAALGRGVVLVLSVWDDYAVNMLWLDSDYPTDSDPSAPGVARGTCATTSGVPATVESQNANAQVTYSNIKVGPIGSTFNQPGGGTTTGSSGPTGSPTTTPTSTPTTVSAPGATQTQYGQCGGIGYAGPTSCASGTSCHTVNTYYSQCL
ncbi:cellobiohydrolase [Gloeopeniophorella convolvens]|nr:cellobiohydrolase [Gloeopeniophorella convolvens]